MSVLLTSSLHPRLEIFWHSFTELNVDFRFLCQTSFRYLYADFGLDFLREAKLFMKTRGCNMVPAVLIMSRTELFLGSKTSPKTINVQMDWIYSFPKQKFWICFINGKKTIAGVETVEFWSVPSIRNSWSSFSVGSTATSSPKYVSLIRTCLKPFQGILPPPLDLLIFCFIFDLRFKCLVLLWCYQIWFRLRWVQFREKYPVNIKDMRETYQIKDYKLSPPRFLLFRSEVSLKFDINWSRMKHFFSLLFLLCGMNSMPVRTPKSKPRSQICNQWIAFLDHATKWSPQNP